MFRFKNFTLSDVNASDTPMQLLYEIFRKTLNPLLSWREFRQYYFSQHPAEMDFTLLYNQGEPVGFFSAAFYPRTMNGKKVMICRSALGLLKSGQSSRFPLGKLFSTFMRFKVQHPLTPLYITGFMANPIMYAMICKYTLTVYPRRDKAVPDAILQFKKELLEGMGLEKKETSPFVLKIHFQVQFSAAEISRFENSTNPDAKYYRQINPDYCHQTGVLVILPVHYLNILYTCFRYGLKRVRKLMVR